MNSYASLPCEPVPRRKRGPGSCPGCRWSLWTGSRCRVGSPGRTWCSEPWWAPSTPSAPSLPSVRVHGRLMERRSDGTRTTLPPPLSSADHHPSSSSSSSTSSSLLENRARQRPSTSRVVRGVVAFTRGDARRCGGKQTMSFVTLSMFNALSRHSVLRVSLYWIK